MNESQPVILEEAVQVRRLVLVLGATEDHVTDAQIRGAVAAWYLQIKREESGIAHLGEMDTAQLGSAQLGNAQLFSAHLGNAHLGSAHVSPTLHGIAGEKNVEFTLRIGQVNANSWGTLKHFLTTEKARSFAILTAQETRVQEDDLKEAQSWALQNGWLSLWEPALGEDCRLDGA